MTVPRELAVTSADGTHLRAVECGPGEAPAMLLLHGVGSSRQFLREAFETPVRAAGWRLVAADLRGHGRSAPVRDPADHAHGRHVEDVVALADEVGADVVGGVSLGGHAAVGAVLAGLPCRAVLACLPAWSGRAVPGHGPHAAVAQAARQTGIADMVAGFRRDTAMVPWLREVLVRDWSRHDPDSLHAALAALDGGLAPTTAELATLPVPMGLVAWPDDPGHPVAVARSWARTAPRAALRRITLGEVEDDRTAVGRAAVAALAALEVTT